MYRFSHDTDQEAQLMNINEDDVGDAILVFDGDCTCCDREHQGMPMCDKEVLRDVFLGIYAEVLWKNNIAGFSQTSVPSDQHRTEEIISLIQKRKDRIFPPRFVATFSEVKKSKYRSDLDMAAMNSVSSSDPAKAPMGHTTFDVVQKFSSNKTKTDKRIVKKKLFGSLIDTLESMIKNKADSLQFVFEGEAKAQPRRKSLTQNLAGVCDDLEPTEPTERLESELTEVSMGQVASIGSFFSEPPAMNADRHEELTDTV
jgi:hypothetical protein